jgi:hypothetical protein
MEYILWAVYSTTGLFVTSNEHLSNKWAVELMSRNITVGRDNYTVMLEVQDLKSLV